MNETNQPLGLTVKTCRVAGCDGRTIARGLCGNHYARLRRTGDINESRPINVKSGHYNPNWRGGKAIHQNGGRTMIYSPGHPGGKYIFRYRLVMEAHLGRYLTDSEVVHHINGNPTDDRLENLAIMSQSEHAALHHSAIHKWATKHTCCVQCGDFQRRHAGLGLCSKCHSKRYRQLLRK